MTSLVIPVRSGPRNHTLPLALWSMRQHASWLHPVLIGDPRYLEPALSEYPDGHVIPFTTEGDDPIANTTAKLAAALESEIVTDPFVWSNDDIFFLAPVSLDDLRAAGATARGRLEDAPTRGRYGERAHETKRLLRSRRVARPTYDYERHVPLVVNRADMARVLIEFGAQGYPRSLYQNIALEEPAFISRDVKVFRELDLVNHMDPLFLSTGEHFPIESIRRALGLA